ELLPSPSFDHLPGTPLVKWDGKPSRVIVGEAGVSVDGDDDPVSITWDQCAVAIVTPTGEHHLLDVSGAALRFNPWDLREGQAAIDTIRAHLDPRVYMRGEESGRWRSLWHAAGTIDRAEHWKNLVDTVAKLRADERVSCLAGAKCAKKSGLLVLTNQR